MKENKATVQRKKSREEDKNRGVKISKKDFPVIKIFLGLLLHKWQVSFRLCVESLLAEDFFLCSFNYLDSENKKEKSVL